jgi:deazaflavin-dependent oxidoreductase (nitroreductase family)
MGKLNIPIYRATKGRFMNKVGNAPVLLITTTGRKSKQLRTAPVCYLADGERLIVIGSNAGNANAPAWALNLQADANAEVEVRGEHRRVRARVADGEERADLWRKMNEQYSGFDTYEARTDRNIALFVLDPA